MAPSRTSQYSPRSVAAQKTYSLAQKPATNGMPPSDSRKSSIASASSGERWASPRNAVVASEPSARTSASTTRNAPMLPKT